MARSVSNGRRAVLDIGSNSVRLVIYELFGAHFSAVFNEKVLAGLGRDLRRTGKLSPEGMELALSALKRFQAIIEARNIETVLIGATAALRNAEDAGAFITAVREQTGFDIAPVSGEEEGRLSTMGLISAEPRACGIAADLGGASLELTTVSEKTVSDCVSLPLGPYAILGQELTNAEIFKDSGLRRQILKMIKTGFAGFSDDHQGPRDLYLIGGAWRNLAGIYQQRISYPMRTLQAYEMASEEARNLGRWACSFGREAVMSWPGLNRRRTETLPYGGYLLDILIELFEPDRVIVSTTGLREGMLFDSLSKSLKSRDSLLDGCRDLASGNVQGASLGKTLFDFLKPATMKFPKAFEAANENRLRRAACYLAGIGKGLHPDYRAQLVFENVFYAPLAGLTHKERAYLAHILFSSYTGKDNVPNGEAMMRLLDPADSSAARLYGTAMRLAMVASGRSRELIKVFELSWDDEVLVLSVNAERADLLSDLVKYRLRKLGSRGGFETRSETRS